VRRHNARRQALRILYESDISGRDPEEVLTDTVAAGGIEPYAVFLVEGISKRLARIDEIISDYAVGWDPHGMPAVDRNVQRIGVFEIVFTDSPEPVAIDEAVELAKEYSSADAARFVNGVLSSVARDRKSLCGDETVESSADAELNRARVATNLEAMTSDLCPPAYGRRSLAEVGKWILSSIGIGDWDEDIFDLPAPPQLRRLVVVVIDGLGALQLRDHREVLETIWELPGTFATSTFPSTSATGLTSICTAAFPAKHGVLGYRLAQRGRSFNVIRYAFDEDLAEEKLLASGIVSARKTPPIPSPKKFQPMRTIFEAASRAKIGAFVVTKDEFEGSGFSEILLRGASWLPYKRSSEAASKVRTLLEDTNRKLIYLYWDGLDKQGHKHSPASSEWMTAASRADSICARLVELLGPGDGLLVTSDHGMVSTPKSSWIPIDSEVKELCRVIAGEPRVRYFHARPGSEQRLYDAISDRYGKVGWIFRRDQAISLGLFGDVPTDAIETRIGDVIVAMRNDCVLVDPDWPKPPPSGNHGSLTEAEMFVPFRVIVGA
jgi:transcription antitermination factor NusB